MERRLAEVETKLVRERKANNRSMTSAGVARKGGHGSRKAVSHRGQNENREDGEDEEVKAQRAIEVRDWAKRSIKTERRRKERAAADVERCTQSQVRRRQMREEKLRETEAALEEVERELTARRQARRERVRVHEPGIQEMKSRLEEVQSRNAEAALIAKRQELVKQKRRLEKEKRDEWRKTAPATRVLQMHREREAELASPKQRGWLRELHLETGRS